MNKCRRNAARKRRNEEGKRRDKVRRHCAMWYRIEHVKWGIDEIRAAANGL